MCAVCSSEPNRGTLAAMSGTALWYHVDAGDADAANLFHYSRIAARAEDG
jgi:hypothetical protein